MTERDTKTSPTAGKPCYPLLSRWSKEGRAGALWCKGAPFSAVGKNPDSPAWESHFCQLLARQPEQDWASLSFSILCCRIALPSPETAGQWWPVMTLRGGGACYTLLGPWVLCGGFLLAACYFWCAWIREKLVYFNPHKARGSDNSISTQSVSWAKLQIVREKTCPFSIPDKYAGEWLYTTLDPEFQRCKRHRRV